VTMEQYVKKGISKSNGLEEVMERRQTEKMMEYQNTKLDALIAEEKKKLKEATPTTIDSSQTSNFAATLFVGRTPAEIKEIISSFNQEEMDKFLYLSGRGNSNSFANMRGVPHDSNTEVKNMLEALKIGLDAGRKNEGNGVDMKGIAEIFKAGVDAARVQQQPANPQGDVQFKLVENTLAELKATREDSARQERLRTEKEIAELKSRPSGLDELFYNEEKAAKARKIFGGADTGATNEYSLKKLEMEQNKDIEDRKQSWEEKKWTQEQEGQGKTIEQIKDVLKIVGEGPLGKVIENLGSAGAEKIRGSKTRNSNSQAQPPQIAKVNCPNCAGDFQANIQLPQVQCPLCGVLLQSGNQPAHEQAEHSPSNQAQESPASNTPQEQQVPTPTPDPKQVQPSQTATQEKPVDQTVEAEPVAEQPTNKQ